MHFVVFIVEFCTETKKNINQKFFKTMEKKHILFILSNIRTLNEFELSSFTNLHRLAKESENTDLVMLYSHCISIISELQKMINRAMLEENLLD
jgi:hypothetical protein